MHTSTETGDDRSCMSTFVFLDFTRFNEICTFSDAKMQMKIVFVHEWLIGVLLLLLFYGKKSHLTPCFFIFIQSELLSLTKTIKKSCQHFCGLVFFV